MAGRYAFTRKPGWVIGHVIVLALFVTMVLLGRWQLDVSESKGFNVQNFGYALQWWAFACFGAFLWYRVLRDQAKHNEGGFPTRAEAVAAAAAEQPQQVAYRRYVPPPSAVPANDQELAAYNAYLANLNEKGTA
jgi:DNA-binding transcriptional regulator of glucitol operon